MPTCRGWMVLAAGIAEEKGCLIGKVIDRYEKGIFKDMMSVSKACTGKERSGFIGISRSPLYLIKPGERIHNIDLDSAVAAII